MPKACKTKRTFCPFCGWESEASKNKSNQVYRHIQKEAQKPAEKLGNHPAHNDPAYEKYAKDHKFAKTKAAATQEEKHANTRKSDNNYKRTRRQAEHNKLSAVWAALE
jgi:site-specific DNA-cytosine methylase